MQQVEHRTSRRSFVSEVADALRDQIEAGFYAPGDKLPTEPALM
ncbi:GntR family transcriptional regulator [Mesorhizobium sp. M0296]